MFKTSLKRRGAVLSALAAVAAAVVMASCNSPDGVLIPIVGASSASSGAGGAGAGAGGTGVGGGGTPADLWSLAIQTNDQVTPVGLAVDPNGSSSVLLRCAGAVDFGEGLVLTVGGLDVCVAKYDASGKLMWHQIAGSIEDDEYARSVAAHGDNTIIMGTFSETMPLPGLPTLMGEFYDSVFVAKLSANGAFVWGRALGTNNSASEDPRAVAVDQSDGDVVIAGNFEGTANFGGADLTAKGYYDGFLVKLDSDGNHLWSKSFGVSQASHEVTDVAIDGSGRVLLTGYIDGGGDFGGGIIPGKGADDIFVAVFDADGTHLWSKSFGDSGDQSGERIAADAAGNIYLAGHFWYSGCAVFDEFALCGKGINDIFLVKFDPSGAYQWASTYGDDKDQLVTDLTVDAAGNAYLTGYFTGTMSFGGAPLGPVIEESQDYTCYDAFVAKFDAAGKHLASARYGGTSIDGGDGIGVDPSGNALVTGFYYLSIDFGGEPLPDVGNVDGATFLAKLPL